jgi:serine protease Do
MENISKAIVQVSTPQCIGNGLVLPDYNLIVTNLHLVDGSPEVVISSKSNPPILAQVEYTDEIYDLAFIALPTSISARSLSLTNQPLVENQPVFTYTNAQQSGKITNTASTFYGINHIQTDIAIATDYSGSPLVNEIGEVIGLISGLLQNGNPNISYALPSEHILKSLEAFKKVNSNSATRCRNCETIVAVNTVGAGNLCPSCGESVELPHQALPYQAEGVSRTIEALIQELGHEPVLTRRGPYQWALIEGSATIFLSYYEPRGYIMGDAFLCQMPENGDTDRIYEFLLRQNYSTKGLTFSIHQKDIVLSLIIYDRHLNTDTAKELLQNLLERADYYDNVLVEEYGAAWKE